MNLQFELVNEDSLKDFLEIYDIDNHINSNYDKAKLRLKELLPTEFHYTVKIIPISLEYFLLHYMVTS